MFITLDHYTRYSSIITRSTISHGFDDVKTCHNEHFATGSPALILFAIEVKKEKGYTSGRFFNPAHYMQRSKKETIMIQAKQGDTVKVHYTGKLDDGTVFDTSRNRNPLQFTIGKGQVIVGFEQAIDGMTTGESKTVTIPMENAYGPHRKEMIITMERSKLPADLNPKVGQRLELTQMDDRNILVTVTAVTDSILTLDANHPLSGKNLVFDIELVGII